MDDIKVDEWIRTFWCRSGGEDFTGWRIIAAGASPEVIAAAGECLEWNPVLQVHASYGYPATGRNQVGSCCVECALAAAGRWLNSSTAWKNCTESRPDFGEVKVDVWEKPGKNGGAVDPEECVLLALKHDRRLCCSMAGRTL